MLIYPAIDVRGGQCVRLKQGDYQQETVFGDDPAAMAQRWVQQGAAYLHIVDLDGAREGRPVNGPNIGQIVKAAGVPCQLGGGLRSEADIALALSWGVQRVILGTRALEDREWFHSVCRQFPGKIVAGIDARQGKIATRGWLETSACSALDLVRHFTDWPLAAIIYTDIGRDGMLAGPNCAELAELAAVTPLPVIASGGVTTLDDVRRLADLKLSGCIIGRALYEGQLHLSEAISIAGSQ